MEEIGTTEAIQKEILEEARKAADKVLRDADEEAAFTVAQAVERARNVTESVGQAADAWIARNRAEMLARIPLEKIRYRTALVDGRVRKALADLFEGMSEDRIAGLIEEHMKACSAIFNGRAVNIRYKGLSKARAVAAVQKALGVPEPSEALEDSKLPAAGLVVHSADGKMTLRATMDLVESDLLDRQRGELSRALCAEALKE